MSKTENQIVFYHGDYTVRFNKAVGLKDSTELLRSLKYEFKNNQVIASVSLSHFFVNLVVVTNRNESNNNRRTIRVVFEYGKVDTLKDVSTFSYNRFKTMEETIDYMKSKVARIKKAYE